MFEDDKVGLDALEENRSRGLHRLHHGIQLAGTPTVSRSASPAPRG